MPALQMLRPNATTPPHSSTEPPGSVTIKSRGAHLVHRSTGWVISPTSKLHNHISTVPHRILHHASQHVHHALVPVKSKCASSTAHNNEHQTSSSVHKAPTNVHQAPTMCIMHSPHRVAKPEGTNLTLVSQQLCTVQQCTHTVHQEQCTHKVHQVNNIIKMPKYVNSFASCTCVHSITGPTFIFGFFYCYIFHKQSTQLLTTAHGDACVAMHPLQQHSPSKCQAHFCQ